MDRHDILFSRDGLTQIPPDYYSLMAAEKKELCLGMEALHKQMWARMAFAFHLDNLFILMGWMKMFWEVQSEGMSDTPESLN